jgi:hypothetical protein
MIQVVHVKLNPGLSWQKQRSTRRRLFTSKLDLNLREKLVKRYILNIVMCGAETWTFRKVNQKYLESFKMWYWRRMEKISWPDLVRNQEVLHRVNETRNILHTLKRRKADWIGHILCRNYFLKHFIEGNVDGMSRRGRRRKQILDKLKKKDLVFFVKGR